MEKVASSPADDTLALPCCSPPARFPPVLLGWSDDLPSSSPAPVSPASRKLTVRKSTPSFTSASLSVPASASVRLTVFSNPEQARRCGQGREEPHRLGSQRPWQGGAPGTCQPLGPPGLCSPRVYEHGPADRHQARMPHCLRSPKCYGSTSCGCSTPACLARTPHSANFPAAGS